MEHRQMGVDIDELEFSIRTLHCLRNARINTLDELQVCTAGCLMEIPNFGKRSLEEVREVLGQYGRALVGETAPRRTQFVPRRVVQIACTDFTLYALADDGTVWVASPQTKDQWQHCMPLPAREVEIAPQQHPDDAGTKKENPF